MSPAKPPSADSVHVLLKQALHADDRSLLLDCLYRQNEKVIANSVSLLNPSDLFKLLESLISMIQSRGAVVACTLPWLKSLLLQHASSIMSQESSFIALNSLYQEEVKILSSAHPNNIRVLGCCKQGNMRILVYEHMEKSLAQIIDGEEQLSWGNRLQIVMGVAHGLSYLYSMQDIVCHFGCDAILLDKEFKAKLGGFRWAKHNNGIVEPHDNVCLEGTFGYLKEGLGVKGPLIRNSSIKCFGLVLLTTITGKKLPDIEKELQRLERLVKKGPNRTSMGKKVKKVMDRRLNNNFPLEGAFKCIALAVRCIDLKPNDTPSTLDIM